jgi:hypothetical protein
MQKYVTAITKRLQKIYNYVKFDASGSISITAKEVKGLILKRKNAGRRSI